MHIPDQYQEFLDLTPEQIQALCDELAERPLDAERVESWLKDWGRLAILFQESMARLDVATAVNTADEGARQRVAQYRETVMPIGWRMEDRLAERRQQHASWMPDVLRAAETRSAQAARLNQSQDAIDLLNRESELLNQYGEIVGKRTIPWEGEELIERRLTATLERADRQRRELGWRAVQERAWQDRDAIGRIWAELIDSRSRLAEMNGFEDYLAYRWAELGRTDYTPDDCRAFHAAVLKHWSPLYAGLVNEQKERLKVDTLRPWDSDEPPEQEPLRPYDHPAELLQKTLNLFRRMDAEFGAYVEKLRDMGFIDLAERPNTVSSGGFSRVIGLQGNFIFMNIRRTAGDVVGLVHEIGHAVANYASGEQPYPPLWGFPADFSEAPSSAMELLTQPHWDEFYDAKDLQRARHQHYRGMLRRTLFECVFDSFQHWAYRNLQDAQDLDACDAQWHDLICRYQPGTDWAGIEHLNGIGWQGLSLSFYLPLHAMEYVYGRMAGLKLAVQPEREALSRYKRAIALGSSVSAKGLYAALGVDFPFAEDDVMAAAQTVSAWL